MKNKRSKTENQNLSKKLDSLTVKVDKLAVAMEQGFSFTTGGFKRMEEGFLEAQENTDALARMVSEGFDRTDKEFQSIRTELSILEQGQENILLRIDNLTPQFETRQLEKRVKRLEDKAGIKNNL